MSEVEAELERALATPPGGSDRLYAAMRHAVLGGGKRLRPILCIATHRSLAGHDPAIYPVSAAIEMLHAYSLIHDDLPCMDDDDQRRGRPTVHVAFDEATAVLAGDALQALAFGILTRHAAPEVVQVIARAVGPLGMAGGQMADLEAEGEIPTEELVLSIHRQKTGELIAASVVTGGLMAGASGADLKALESYGRSLGLAFQIVDDILELTIPAERLGKPVGSDLKHQKVTFPAAVGLEAAHTRAAALIEEAEKALRAFSGDPALLVEMAEFVLARDH
jgi:geranylgeranyl pyrophosphate synthase